MTAIVETEDGSFTLKSELFGESYHSTRGAIGESMHTFINAALRQRATMEDRPKQISIFEVGFGSGLNCYLTMMAARELGVSITYHVIELYPIEESLAESYGRTLGAEEEFRAMHSAAWGERVSICKEFDIIKIKEDFTKFCHKESYDVIYFDAFSPDTVPDMWSIELFKRLYSAANDGCILTTYCAKGSVRRDLAAAGFSVSRIEGALGKRHMTRATKHYF